MAIILYFVEFLWLILILLSTVSAHYIVYPSSKWASKPVIPSDLLAILQGLAGHCTVSLPQTDGFFVIGGYTLIINGSSQQQEYSMENTTLDKAYFFHFPSSRWSAINLRPNEQTGRYPSPRGFHQMATKISGNYSILHGGLNLQDGKTFSDVWLLDWTTLRWIQLKQFTGILTSPAALYQHAMIYDELRDLFLIQGGLDSLNFSPHRILPYLYRLTVNPETRQFSMISQSVAGSGPIVYAHSAVWLADNFSPNSYLDSLVVYTGGLNISNSLAVNNYISQLGHLLRCTKASKYQTCFWQPFTLPSYAQRFGHGSVINTETMEVVIFGGVGENSINTRLLATAHINGLDPSMWTWALIESPLPFVSQQQGRRIYGSLTTVTATIGSSLPVVYAIRFGGASSQFFQSLVDPQQLYGDMDLFYLFTPNNGNGSSWPMIWPALPTAASVLPPVRRTNLPDIGNITGKNTPLKQQQQIVDRYTPPNNRDIIGGAIIFPLVILVISLFLFHLYANYPRFKLRVDNQWANRIMGQEIKATHKSTIKAS